MARRCVVSRACRSAGHWFLGRQQWLQPRPLFIAQASSVHAEERAIPMPLKTELSILFAMMYVGTLSAAAVVLKRIIVLFFGCCVERTGAIWGAALAHSLMLISIIHVLPYVNNV